MTTTQSNDIAEAVLNYIRTQLAAEAPNLGADTLLFGDGYLDSTAMLELILWIGDTFDITIQNEDLTPENFASVRHIVEFVRHSKSAQMDAEAVAPAGNE